MKNTLLVIASLLLFGCQNQPAKSPQPKIVENNLMQNAKQLTFSGKRSGEGYFSNDGQLMAFQSERSEDNPFYQIYVMDLETRESQRVSPGYGKTTCAWIHPDKKKVQSFQNF